MNRLSFHLAAAAIAATAFLPNSGGAPVSCGLPADTTRFAGNPEAIDTLSAIGGDAFPAQRRSSKPRVAFEAKQSPAFRYRGEAEDPDEAGPDSADVHPGVPEPPCWLLIVAGAALLAFHRRPPIQ